MFRLLNVEILIIATYIPSTPFSRLTDLMGMSLVYIYLCVYMCVCVSLCAHVWFYEILSHI